MNNPDTVFDTVFEKKNEKRRNRTILPMSGIPYFTGTTALYDTGRNSLERRPISNKIHSPNWPATKVTGQFPFAFVKDYVTMGL